MSNKSLAQSIYTLVLSCKEMAVYYEATVQEIANGLQQVGLRNLEMTLRIAELIESLPSDLYKELEIIDADWRKSINAENKTSGGGLKKALDDLLGEGNNDK